MSVKYPEHQTAGFALNEADTCRKHVVPKLETAGWDTDPRSITGQRTFTDGELQLLAACKHVSRTLKVPPNLQHENVNEIIGGLMGRISSGT
jgi:hypothetical protein